jgi:gliding motility-associated-like protein
VNHLHTTFENTSEAGTQFIWTFGDGTTSTETNPTHTFNAGTYTIKLVAIDSATCNIIDSTSATLNVFAKPTAAFDIASPQPPPVNTAITFTNSSSADAVRFKWLFGDGDSLITISRGPIEHEFNATNTFEVLLIAYNSNGCTDTASRLVTAIVEPAVDVPNAFTPLSGDINSVVMVRGYAIGKMKFIIWNRWGQKVFETENRKQGWDGRFKGAVQPMDVYVYTLEVEFTDGTKAVKKGDITLIR